MKPLDIILTPEGNVAVVTEVCIVDNAISIVFLNHFKNTREKNAWWTTKEQEKMTLLDSLPHLLSNTMAHNMGSNTKQGSIFFPLKD